MFKRVFHSIVILFVAASEGSANDSGNLNDMKPVSVPGMFEHYSYYRHLPDANQKTIAKYKAKVSSSKGALSKGAALLDYAILLSKSEQAAFDAAQAKNFNPSLKVDNTRSQRYVQKARQILSAAVKKTKRRNPNALYLYAYALALNGQPLAVNVFDEIVTGFKETKIASEAVLALGEFYFFSQDLERANREYQTILKADDPPVRYYAQYKLAWSNYLSAKGAGNSKGLTKSLLDLADLIKILGNVKEERIKNLAKQVEFDTVGLSAELTDPEDVKRVLSKAGKPEIYDKTIARMAMLKAQSGDLGTAYKLYASLHKSSPESEHAPEYSKMMVEIGAALQNTKVVYANLAYMGKTYVLAKSKWRKSQSKELLEKVDKEVPDFIFGYGVEFDRLSYESKDPVLRDYAYKLYSIYLASSPSGPSASDARYNLAMIQTERKQFEAAAKNFARILVKDKKVKDKANIAAVMVEAAAHNIANEREAYKLPPPGQATKPVAFSKAGKLYNFTLDLALKQPADRDRKAIYLFEIGLMHFDFGHYQEAKKYFNSMLKIAPNNEYAADAAARLFEYSIQQKDKQQFLRTEKLVSVSDQLRTNENVVYYLSTGYPDGKKNSASQPVPSKTRPAISENSEETQNKNEATAVKASDKAEGSEGDNSMQNNEVY